MQSLKRFVKSTAIILLAICYFSLSATAQKVQFRQTPFEEAMAQAKKTGKILFVDVRGPEKMDGNKKVEQEVLATDSIASWFRKNCIPIFIDMHSEAGKTFAPRLSMLMYPTYIFYDGEGNQLEYINSFGILKDPAQLMSKARASLAQAREKQANKRSIVFSGKKWEALLEQAKKEKKLIFLDAQTEWCRPCILMARNVFTLDRVADFFNENFINVTMDMEKGEGPALAKKYNINAYPTYLFIDGDGKVVHLADGYKEADVFLEVGKKAVEAQGHAKTGIRFSDASWQQMLAEARESNKLIFMDAYAVWCGPCKWMSKNVFPAPEVGNLYNRNFINAYIDMEKGEGLALRKQYNVRAYPTYLFINGQGEVVHRIVGSCDTTEFIQTALDAMSPSRSLQYFTKNDKGKANDYDFVRNYARALSKAYEQDKASEAALTYLQDLDKAKWSQSENWFLINEYVTDATSPLFRYLVANQSSFDKLYGAKIVDQKIYNTFLAWPRRYLTYPEQGSAVLNEAGYNSFMQQVAESNYSRKKEVAAMAELTIRFGMRQMTQYADVVSGMLKDGIIDKTAKGADRLYFYAYNVDRFAGGEKKAIEAALAWTRLAAYDIPEVTPKNKAMYLELYATLLEKNDQQRLAKKVRKEVDKQKLAQAKSEMPFQPLLIMPKQK